MTMHIRHYFKFIFLCSIICFFHCGTQTISGSETTNGLILTVADNRIHGMTIPGNTVYCYSSTFNPDSGTGYSDTVMADLSGNFSFSNCPIATYNIFTYSSGTDSAAIVQEISNLSNKPDTSVSFCKSLAINGTTIHDSTIIKGASVYITGTPFSTKSDSNGTFFVNRIPQGNYVINSIYSIRGTKHSFSDNKVISLFDSWNGVFTFKLDLK